jgi:murein DD-endopeptidase MepM/ murein hydrolase activator NlpD
MLAVMRASRAASFAAGLALMTGAVPAAATSAAGLSAAGSSAAPASAHRTWAWPLEPTPAVVRGFEPPAHAWDAGHRGVDLLGSPAEPVRAIGAGTVRFAGPLAGRGVVVVDHGALRSTYEPVTAAVHRGDIVHAGEVIGLLQTPYSHCAPQACLHLGLRRGSVYLDPLELLGPRPVRLKPLTGGDAAPGPLAQPTPALGPVRRSAASSLDGPDRRSASGPSARGSGGSGPATRAGAAVVVAVMSLLAGLAGLGQARG